ncbi:Hypothetical predicted protein [Cloeon dipterum]|uniref:Uncharacterized protein n=1 Tax=Cloeon dipterum TaxID=197152 RepID=A0A8S1DTC0_9INSE|nr:Hypothetical predicted protein [Cloeon dipterum]
MSPGIQSTLRSNSSQQSFFEDGVQLARPLPEEFIEKLNLNLAMHRFFSFPLDFHLKHPFDLLHTMAELGLFYQNNVIRCKFCALNLSLGEIPKQFGKSHPNSEKLNCKIGAVDSMNLPMENITTVSNYKSEAHRLYSLLKKNNWQHVTPFDLAREGFFYSGKGDTVICVFCNVEVGDWEAGDTPENEHRTCNSECPFLNSKESVANVEIGNEQTALEHDALGKLKTGTTTFDPDTTDEPEEPR